jgi:ferritin
VNNIGITGVHKVRPFQLSLSGTMFNWFTSLASDSVDSWPCLEQKFYDYFYNREVELRLSDLTTVKQKYNESASEYLKRFREMRNRCYNLTIGEKDLADLAFASLASYLKEKLEGQDFVDMNQV